MSEAAENRATFIKEYEKKIDEFFCKPENLADFQNKIYSRELILLVREINKTFNLNPCPISEDELKRIGIHPSRKYASPETFHEYKKRLQECPSRRPFNNKIPRITIKPNPTFPSIYQEGSVEAKIEKVKKEVRGLLNKLISSNFAAVSAEIINKCNWEDKFLIDSIAELIFNKAIREPMFMEIYADLCLVLHKAEDSSEKENYKFHFRSAIIRNVQQSFEAIALSYNNDKKNGDRKLLMIGILKFISHLYRIKWINYKIVEKCIVLLIQNAEEYASELMTEYAVILMKTVGPFLRKEETTMMNGYISYLERFKTMVSNRIKFMIVDLMEAQDIKLSDKMMGKNSSRLVVRVRN